MPIQIIDGFRLGASKPIDDRIVASGSDARLNIPNKYDGLLVVDIKDHTPYVWNSDSGTWSAISSKNNGGDSSSSYGESTYVGDTKNIYIGGNSTTKNVYIGDSINKSDLTVSNNLNVSNNLVVSNDLKVSGIISGNGSNITNINSANISAGTGTSGQVLQLNSQKVPTWTSLPSSTSVINASVGSTNYYIGFLNNTTGGQINNIYNNNLIGLSNNILYLNGVAGLSSSFGTFSRVAITDLNVSGSATFSRVAITDLNVSRSATFSRVFITGLSASTATFSRVAITDLTVSGSVTFGRVDITDLNVSGAATFSRIQTTYLNVTTATFSSIALTTSPGPNKVLMSNATGQGTWQSLPNMGSPYGSIIIWAINCPIPSDYKVCNGVGFICLDGLLANGQIGKKYMAIPDLNDRNISGVTTYSDLGIYGSLSPLTAKQFFVRESNLPKHTHSLVGATGSTNVTGSHTHRLKTDGTSTDEGTIDNDAGKFEKFGLNDNAVEAAGDHSHTVTLSGSTSDGNFTNTAIALPITKGYKVLFLIKINPSAGQLQAGHYSLTEIQNNYVGGIGGAGDFGGAGGGSFAGGDNTGGNTGGTGNTTGNTTGSTTGNTVF